MFFALALFEHKQNRDDASSAVAVCWGVWILLIWCVMVVGHASDTASGFVTFVRSVGPDLWQRCGDPWVSRSQRVDSERGCGQV